MIITWHRGGKRYELTRNAETGKVTLARPGKLSVEEVSSVDAILRYLEDALDAKLEEFARQVVARQLSNWQLEERAEEFYTEIRTVNDFIRAVAVPAAGVGTESAGKIATPKVAVEIAKSAPVVEEPSDGEDLEEVLAALQKEHARLARTRRKAYV